MEKFTADTLLNPELALFQPEDGYRFSMDSILLASHLTCLKDQKVLDIGTGCGVLPIILVRRFPGIQVLGVEIQKELADTARRNVAANQMEKQICILNADITGIGPGDLHTEFDIIISNPPYQKTGSGRLSKNTGKAFARHEIHLDIDRLCRACSRLIRPQGKVYLIYPAGRKDELITVMNQHHLIPEKIFFIHTRRNHPARRIIVIGIKDGQQDCTIMPPVYIPDRTD